MLVDFAALTQTVEVPTAWPEFVVATDSGFTIKGDPVAANELFLYTGGGRVVVADQLPVLLEYLQRQGIEPQLSAFGISSLLHHGLVPVPYTEFEDIYMLCIGDTAEVSRDTAGWSVSLSFEYPWLPGASREDQEPDIGRLFSLLLSSVDREVDKAGHSGFLMLSGGKDSVSLALALAELGYRDIPCVTFSNGDDDPEATVSSEICARLGLQHKLVTVPESAEEVRRTLTSFFTNASRPGTDLAQIPYLFGVAAAEVPSGTVFDGDGNDAYMGYLVSGSFKAKMRYRIRSRAMSDFVKRHTPVDSPLNYLARSRVEIGLPGRTMRPHEIRAAMPGAIDTTRYWRDLDSQTQAMGPLDIFACVTVRHVLPGSSLKKHILAAQALGHRHSVPWSDRDIAEYYFNLPEADRFDVKSGTNKVLLRRLLEHYLDYDSAEVGKHYFTFDGAGFVRNNLDFIRSEIMQCRLWNREGLDLAGRWLDRVESRPMLYHAILDLFMVSGWLNHSRFVGPTLVESLRES